MTKRIKVRKRRLPAVQTTFGIAWYRPWQWERLRELATDSENIENTYGAWLDVVQARLREMNRAGIFPVKVDVDLDELVAWCKQKGVPLDAGGRAKFVAQKARRGEYIQE